MEEVFSKNRILPVDKISGISAFADIQSSLPPSKYVADYCILCGEKFGIFNKRCVCKHCNFSFCKNCFKKETEDQRCDICKSFEDPKLNVTKLNGLYNWMKKDKQRGNDACYASQVAADLLIRLLDSQIHEEHELASNCFEKNVKIIESLPFEKAFVVRFLDHAVSCNCEAKAMTIDIFCSLISAKTNIFSKFTLNYSKLKALVLSKEQHVTRATARLILLLTENNKLEPDEPEVIDQLNSNDKYKVLFIITSLALKSNIESISSIHKQSNLHDDKPAFRCMQELLNNAMTLITKKDTHISIVFFALLVVMRISKSKEGAGMITKMIVDNQSIFYRLVDLVERFYSKSANQNTTNNDENCFPTSEETFACAAAEIVYQLWYYNTSSETITQVLYPPVLNIIMSILGIHSKFSADQYTRVLQNILIDTSALISSIEGYEDSFIGEPIRTILENLNAERISATANADDKEIEESPEIKEAQKEISEVEEEKRKLEEEKESATQRIEKIKEEKIKEENELAKKMEKLNQQKNKVNESISKKNAKIENLKSKQDKIQDQLNQIEEKIKQSEDEQVKIAAEKTLIAANMQKMESEINEKQKEIQEKKATLEAKKAELENLKTEAMNHDSNKTSRLNEIDALNREVSSLKEEKDDVLSRVKREEEKKQSIYSQIEETKQLQEQTKTKITEIQNEIEQKNKEIAALNESSSSTKAENEELHQEITNLDANIEKKEHASRDLRTKISTLSVLIETTNSSIKSIRNKHEQEISSKEETLATVDKQYELNIEGVTKANNQKYDSLLSKWKEASDTLATLGFTEFTNIPSPQ